MLSYILDISLSNDALICLINGWFYALTWYFIGWIENILRNF